MPLASVHAHGKAFYEENDLYTHTGHKGRRPASKEPDLIRESRDLGGYARVSEACVFAQAIVRGEHLWFAELAGWVGGFKENYSDPQFLAEVRRLNGNVEPLLNRDRSSVTELAFVLDEKSVAHLSLDHKGFLKNVYHGSVGWGHTGAPFDLLLLDDLVEKPLRQLPVGGSPRA